MIFHSRDKTVREIEGHSHAPEPTMPPRCLSCPALISYKSMLYSHILHPQREVIPPRTGQLALHFLLKVKPVNISIHGQVAQQSDSVPWHSGMRDCLSVLVCLCMQPNLQKLAFIINFGPLRFEYITAKGQNNQCQKEQKKKKDMRTSESQFYL